LGFNALNASEEKIIQHLIAADQAKIYWDSDQTFLNDPLSCAGLFVRRFKKSWKQYKSNPFEWIVDDFSQTKHSSYWYSKTIGQAKLQVVLLRI
jgi:hypothetical protein